MKIPAIQLKNGATVCTPDGFAMKARKERLRRVLRSNLKQHACNLKQKELSLEFWFNALLNMSKETY